MSAHPEQNQQIVPPEAPVLKPAVPRAEDLQNLSQLDPRIKQHRCHPRLADAVHSVMEFMPLREQKLRIQLAWRCYQSEVGQEPMDPYLLDPAEQLPKLRKYKPNDK